MIKLERLIRHKRLPDSSRSDIARMQLQVL